MRPAGAAPAAVGACGAGCGARLRERVGGSWHPSAVPSDPHPRVPSAVGISAELTPRGPYSLRLSARGANDATRRWDRARLTACLGIEGRQELDEGWRRPDG